MILTFILLLLFSNGLTIRPDTSILYSRIGLLIVFYSIISTMLSFHITYLQTGIGLYGGLFHVTPITHGFQIFILLLCGIILLMTGFYPRKKHKGVSMSLWNKVKEYTSIINKTSEQFTIIEYALIIIFVISGATLLLTSSDLGSIYLCIELQSFSLYIISAMHRNSESSTGSALTYFLLGGLSSCFILLGLALIYANAGLTNLDGIYSIISDSEKYLNFSTWYIHNYIFYALILISVGFLFKIAAAPFHWWSPDVYDGVPTIVTTFIAILPKIAILVIFLELSYYTSTLIYSMIQYYSWTVSLFISCLLSLIVGTVLGLTQIRIKRLLAYSTISHIGFILLALIAYSIESYQAYIFYIIQYILTNLNAFVVIIGIGFSLYLYYTNISENNNISEKNNSPIQLISQLKGYFSINPALALCLIITIFSFIGLPPLAGFFGKQMVLTSALNNNHTILVIVAILTSVIGAVYYLSIIKTIYFNTKEYIKSYKIVQISLSNYLSISLAILTLIISVFILIPNEPINLSNLLANSLADTASMDFEEKELYKFFSDTWNNKYSKYDILMSNLPLFIITSMCIGLGIIILISKSETATVTITTTDTNKDTIQKPEVTVTDKPATKEDRTVVDVGYTTAWVGNRLYRVLYDKNQESGENLLTLYNSPRFIASNPTRVTVLGRQFVGIRFSNSNLTGYIQTDSRRRQLSFHYTFYDGHSGIWVPKPTNATGRIIGLIGSRGELILANGRPALVGRTGNTFFIRGGLNST
jgi:NADH-ubiquinone oxidoreductase chain 2